MTKLVEFSSLIKSGHLWCGQLKVSNPAHAPEPASKVRRRHVRELVVREVFATAVRAEIALGATKRLVFVVAIVDDAIVFFSDGVHIEVPN